MSPSANRYTGPVPTCPDSLDAKLPPDFLGEAVEVPTSEVYSAALEAAWEELGGQERALREGRRPDPERVEHLEPDPTDDSKPRPKHYGAYALERASLDWSYHVLPTKARQALQDQIVKLVLEARVRECSEAGDDEPCRVSERREGFEEGEREGRVDGVREEQMGRKGADGEEGRPLALFTAGGMGAGKGHTLREMLKTGRIRLPANTVWIDPDALSRLLPERPLYLSHSASTASSLLHPEASLLQEICAAVAKSQKRSLVIDGSLTDCKWFEGFMRGFREKGYDCEILFVSAPLETMLARAARRAKTTGRVTNPDAIRKSRIKSPECVSRLAKPGLVRRVRLIDNSSDSSSTSCTGPLTLYDSALDPDWPSSTPTPYSRGKAEGEGRGWEESGWVDATGFVEGRLRQEEDGKVVRVGEDGEKGETDGKEGEAKDGKL
ncbi:hypothetical protein NBRC10512_005907 [Rhodotorula toruloides]|uniref:RHTO0S08e07514g1_1 n=2 Tax=Rhodotorula toruloides TaxID=5286 RepID=A0A061B230_RHOTO|nr:zeta toxin, P-loop nucleoside triphosphate hydrolase [Rhodotorula toruloides NP11]EMS22174.1 zeta toxin, P-loop nucleoside triphosphate hydrolase [Rhodotorula toruloides NP11]CDR43884.1 RHTO0S08e07514g1_1 [Rhodotorula toruloides]